MTVAAVDIGTNSTRLLIADGERELIRETIVTRLGEGVDATGRLGDAARGRVLDVLAAYRATIEEHDCDAAACVMTSAVRDAANGRAFAADVEDALGFAPRILSGDEEARLTYAGATYGRAGEFLVVDVGGGSTELVLGSRFHVSTQVGVVRHSERHLHSDPPTARELDALARDVHATLAAQVPEPLRRTRPHAIGVAGTPTQAAAVDLELKSYDPVRVEGHLLSARRIEELLTRLGSLPLARRRRVTGIDPARAPVIVAGLAILHEVVTFFGLDRIEVSERDILWGLARAITVNP